MYPGKKRAQLGPNQFDFAFEVSKNVPNHYLELYPPKEEMFRIVFGTFFGDWSLRIELFEIKPPL